MDQASFEGQLLSLGSALRKDGYEFVMPTRVTLQRVNSRPGNEQARSAVDMFGWGRPATQESPAAPWLARLSNVGLAEALPQAGLWRSRVRAASLDQDIVLHDSAPEPSPEASFFGPDSYRFVRAIRAELAARKLECKRALDVGCGAGAAAIALARLFPNAEVVAADIHDSALRYAAVNARLASLHNIATCRSDLFDAVGEGYDLIVANPPFMAGRDRRSCRFGADADGLGLARRLLSGALWKLAPGGTFMMYTGVPIVDGKDAFWNYAATLLDAARVEWRYTELDPDIFGELLGNDAYRHADRIAAVWLVVRTRPM